MKSWDSRCSSHNLDRSLRHRIRNNRGSFKVQLQRVIQRRRLVRLRKRLSESMIWSLKRWRYWWTKLILWKKKMTAVNLKVNHNLKLKRRISEMLTYSSLNRRLDHKWLLLRTHQSRSTRVILSHSQFQLIRKCQKKKQFENWLTCQINTSQDSLKCLWSHKVQRK